jgi:hypothetical protein
MEEAEIVQPKQARTAPTMNANRPYPAELYAFLCLGTAQIMGVVSSLARGMPWELCHLWLEACHQTKGSTLREYKRQTDVIPRSSAGWELGLAPSIMYCSMSEH